MQDETYTCLPPNQVQVDFGSEGIDLPTLNDLSFGIQDTVGFEAIVGSQLGEMPIPRYPEFKCSFFVVSVPKESAVDIFSIVRGMPRYFSDERRFIQIGDPNDVLSFNGEVTPAGQFNLYDNLELGTLIVRLFDEYDEQFNINNRNRSGLALDLMEPSDIRVHKLRYQYDDFDFNKEYIMQPRPSRFAFAAFSDKLLSVRYSDFFNSGKTPTYTYGLCLVEALEFIRLDGKIERVNAFRDSDLFTREQFIQRVRHHRFTREELINIAEGDIEKSCRAYIQRFPQMGFGIYMTHMDKIYRPTLDGLVEVDMREIVAAADEENEQMQPLSALQLFEWWLVYESFHVVPLRREQIVQFLRTRQLQLGAVQKVARFVRDLPLSEQQRVRRDWTCIVSHSPEKKFSIPRAQCEDTLRQKYNEYAEKSDFTGLDFEAFEERKTFTQYKIERNFRLDDMPVFKQLAVQKQQHKIDQIGVIAIDFETVIDNNDMLMIGNVKPYLVCIYGYAWIDTHTSKLVAPHPTERLQKIDVEEDFIGYDCVEKFISWLLSSGIVRTAPLSKDLLTRPKGKNYLRNYENIFIAHNGARFDYRFLVTKLQRFSTIDIIGCKNSMKSFRFKNVLFNDSFQLLPFSLARLCKNFKTRNQKFPYDIEGITIDTWEQNIQPIMKYCRMDCRALHEVYMTYILRRATTYFNNTNFPKQLHPTTQSQAALDIFRSCFLEDTMHSYPETFQYELESYFGGCVQAFDTNCDEAISGDINSSYPASMHNLMPHQPIADANGEYVREVMPPQLYDGSVSFKNTDLYFVTFCFPDDCRYPSLTTRTNSSLINCLRSNADRQWIWGVQLNVAMRYQQCRIVVYKKIEYAQKPVFRKFIETLYRMRQQAVAAKDDVSDNSLKLAMNSSYGKMSQKINPKSQIGTMPFLVEFIQEEMRRRTGFVIIDIKPLVSIDNELYELKYAYDGLQDAQIGCMVRYASYICAVSRANLFRAIVRIDDMLQSTYGEQLTIVYGDTDSIKIRVDKGFNSVQRVQLESNYQFLHEESVKYEQLQSELAQYERMQVLFSEGLQQLPDDMNTELLYNQILHLKESIRAQKELVEYYYANLKETFAENWIVQQVLELRDIDFRCVDVLERLDDPLQNSLLFDNSICGAFKMEKYILRGFYLGAKFYAERAIEGKSFGLIEESCKMKGVQARHRRFNEYEHMFHALFQGHMDEVLFDDRYTMQEAYIKMCCQQQFRTLDSGVRIFETLKIVMPTLSKRFHYRKKGDDRWYSRPFADKLDYQLHYDMLMEENLRLKNHFKVQYQDKIRENARLRQISSIQRDNQLQRQLTKALKEDREARIVADKRVISEMNYTEYIDPVRDENKLVELMLKTRQDTMIKYRTVLCGRYCQQIFFYHRLLQTHELMRNLSHYYTNVAQLYEEHETYIQRRIAKAFNNTSQTLRFHAGFIEILESERRFLYSILGEKFVRLLNFDDSNELNLNIARETQARIDERLRTVERQLLEARVHKNCVSTVSLCLVCLQYMRVAFAKYHQFDEMRSVYMRCKLDYGGRQRLQAIWFLRRFVTHNDKSFSGTWETGTAQGCDTSKMGKTLLEFSNLFATYVLPVLETGDEEHFLSAMYSVVMNMSVLKKHKAFVDNFIEDGDIWHV